MTDQTTDPRSEEQRRSDAELAGLMVARQNLLVAEDPAVDAVVPPNAANAVYDVVIEWQALWGLALSITFKRADGRRAALFDGGGGGAVGGGGIVWGTANLNYTIEQIWDWECRFYFQAMPTAVYVGLFGLSGENVGGVAGWGASAGGGTGGGQGHVHPIR